MQVFLVGGAVRDKLLGLVPREQDWVVTGSTPEAMVALGYSPVGKDFPVFLHPQTKEEYALARTERKSGRGYHGFVFNTDPAVTLEEDLARRDLTINAIAERADGSLVDPWGGRADLAARLLRHVSPAFREDPLRVLRVARFAARFASFGFRVADDTLALLQAMSSSGELNDLTPERVWQETARALAGPAPRVYFETLRSCGALAVLFPELDRLWGVPQRADYHPEVDTGIHVMMVLDQVEKLSRKAGCALPRSPTTSARAPRRRTCCPGISATNTAASSCCTSCAIATASRTTTASWPHTWRTTTGSSTACSS